ncbi:aldehyde dehydrogenase family protein [Bradyrhizobium manausense]
MQTRSNAEAAIHEMMLIGGKSVDATARLEVRNPARPEDLVGTIPRGEADHADQAVAAAKKAHPAWATLTYAERAEFLKSALLRLESEIEKRAAVFVRENGKPLAEARGELLSVPRRQEIQLEYAAQLDTECQVPAANGRSLVLRRPYGVVVSIVPWNSPDVLAFTQIVSALLAGNCVVLKPPETCPLTLIQSCRLFAEDLPPGTINVVTGLPNEIGDALTTHPDVSKVGFTGSIPSARHIMTNAAKSIKGITLELGGNDPAVILEDADFGSGMIDRMVHATFRNSGQVCMAIKRIFVPEKRGDEFIDAFKAAVQKLVVGDGLNPSVTMGPLHTQGAQIKAQTYIGDSQSRGAEIHVLGTIENELVFDKGYFVRPTVVTGLGDNAPLMTEEQFCPVVPITRYGDLDEALERANRTQFGLGGSVWSKDAEDGIAVARKIDAGLVWVNAHGVLAINPRTAYGGVKQSGMGKKSALDGILEYTQGQIVNVLEQ